MVVYDQNLQKTKDDKWLLENVMHTISALKDSFSIDMKFRYWYE